MQELLSQFRNKSENMEMMNDDETHKEGKDNPGPDLP